MRKLMMTFITAIGLIMGSTSTISADDGNGNTWTEAFDSISVSTDAKIRIVHADTFSVNVMSPDKHVREGIGWRVRKGTLEIMNRRETDTDNIRIVITTPKENSPKVMAGYGYEIIGKQS